MACMINLPKLTDNFYQALALKLSVYPPAERGPLFWSVLSEVSSVVHSVDILEAIGRPEGIADLEEAKEPFLKAVSEEFRRLRKDGYSGGDFQLILLDAWLSVCMDIILAPCFTAEELNGG